MTLKELGLEPSAIDAIPITGSVLDVGLNLQLNECKIRVVEGRQLSGQNFETTTSHNLMVLNGISAAAKLRCEVSMDTATNLWPTV